ncbi:nucleoside-diphosphate-sugar epimerase [Teratosphaeria destructans]|uniref:Nucleoside-diphosphate-sugar epimerase n=1 Tax=Teratosphaeria destructans TaxID=418781 RepID=A0A9W7SU54_9PEZI|nr:nucleoside-diphosphate-sugar epimerase [Teratosphaeria destructans]
MAPKVFITGITGYIAGDATFDLYQQHPDYEYAALIRSQEKAETVRKAYPSIRIVLGSLDDSNILTEEASKADIVLRKYISLEENPGYWLHTGGTGILTFADSNSGKLGEWSEKQYNDWTAVQELTGLPDDAFHRNVDKIVLEAGTRHADVLKTAIVCPPTIYGTGRGVVSGRGRQVYELSKLILKEQFIPIIGQGKARWDHIHVHDLSDVYVKLVEKAAAKDTDPEIWGAKGYFLTESGEHIWGELAEQIGRKAEELGLVQKKLEKQPLDKDRALEVAGFEAVSWGLNSRGKGERARKTLAWQPKAASLVDEIPAILKAEHDRLSKSG